MTTPSISTDDGLIQSASDQAQQGLPTGLDGKPMPGMVDPRLSTAVDDTSEQTKRGVHKVGDGIGKTKKDSAGKTAIDKNGSSEISGMGASVLPALGQMASGLLGSAGQMGQGMPQMPQVPASSAGQGVPSSLSDPTLKNAISNVLNGNSESAVGSGAGKGLSIPGGSGHGSPTSVGKNQFQQNIIDLAKQVVAAGVPYSWGSGDLNGPTCSGNTSDAAANAAGDYLKTGFDCSALARFLIYQASGGVEIPRVSGDQYGAGQLVSEPEIGDLAYPTDPSKHVQVYVGDGMVVEAQKSGTNVMFSNVTPGSQFVRVIDAA
ncbi:cell wall-associated hydrolase, invasion-associated protein [Mycobacteroides abscessus subsp. abscessus]|uniref:Cell wall-associated hydrolase, invasion-associated protein n=1 Tax=Mycobacteroides abscessus TaxID=36809 RepID=A0AB33T7A5_9MYCO|nr:NlpC/P60 family protein [Mycobacteroides abscessus]MBN7532261.1 C40 family peptidase [Mycobacteroides abscessus subsp. abscessus]MDO3086012.1 NlpC/P60 family protein [Mycobacteroides abscessus subsp. abscessus]MDO3106035.1 NlpC/P60 family protein [Mycobacteroides abscessus subsp. abscessus]PVA86416.1 hydrolase [Mycobacteroides abscessus]RIT08706.1 hydrolase [Mycobacteroides abscessus]